MQDFVLQINPEKLKQLNIQYSKDRPRKMPSYEEWIDMETKSIHYSMVEKIGSLLEEGTGGHTQIGLLPRIAAQKKRYNDEAMGKRGSTAEVKLIYEDNMIEMALNRRKLWIMKNGGSQEEEEAVKRKFNDRG